GGTPAGPARRVAGREPRPGARDPEGVRRRPGGLPPPRPGLRGFLEVTRRGHAPGVLAGRGEPADATPWRGRPRQVGGGRVEGLLSQPILTPNTRCRITTRVKNPKNALKSSSAAWRQSGAWSSRGRNFRFTYQTWTP